MLTRRKTLMRLPAAGQKRRGIWRVLALGLAVVFGLSLPLFVGGLLATYPLATPPASPAPSVAGVFHVHSLLSDGRGDAKDIARAAKEAGLSFVVTTDHNLESLPAPVRIDGVLLVSAVELSASAGHVVAMGLETGLTASERGPAVLETLQARGADAILAHPVQKKRPWDDWDSARGRVAGFEIYSGDTMLRGALQSPLGVLAPSLISYLANRRHGLLTMVRAPAGAHEKMLELASLAPVAALCAQDAHGLPPYASVFTAMQMVLPWPELPEDPTEAARWVRKGLLGGNSVCVFPALGSPAGFRIDGVSPERREVRVGDTLRVNLPPSTPSEVRLVVFGPARLRDDRTVHITSPGAVQIEVWARAPYLVGGDGWRPWIVPSPIRVVDVGAPAPSAAETPPAN